MNGLEQRSHFIQPALFLTCDDPFAGVQPTERVSNKAWMIEPSQTVSLRENRLAGASMVAAETPRRILEPITVAGENGSELTIDQNNRIVIFKDGAGRRFGFAYDEVNGMLNAFASEYGDWFRERDEFGRYLNSWINSQSGDVWTGEIAIGKTGCSMKNAGEHVLFSPCGTKTHEKFASGELYSRTKEDAQGNTSHEDAVAQTISYKFVDGRSAIRNLLNHSLLGYDATGRLTVMYDADGRKFEFQNFNHDGQPTRILNERGTWNNVGDQIWCNEETGRYWYGTVSVNDNGAYTYKELSGKQTIRYCNGYAVEEYAGIRTITDAQGRRTRQFSDGVQFQEPPLIGRPKFTLRNGVTTDCELLLERGQLKPEKSVSDAYATIKFDTQAPVAAFQDGVVVFSTREAESNDQRKHALIGLSAKDISLIGSYQRMNLGKETVVMQCYDRTQRAIRYLLYVGLEIANVVTGDKVKAGQPIGRIGENGEFTFAIRRNSVSGVPIVISSAS